MTKLRLSEENSATVEFYIDGQSNYGLSKYFDPEHMNLYRNNLRVIYNMKDMSWEEFIQRASYDNNIVKVVRAMQNKMEKSNFIGKHGGGLGDLPEYIITIFGDESDPFDLVLRDYTDTYKSFNKNSRKKHIIKFDAREMDKNDYRASSYMGYVHGGEDMSNNLPEKGEEDYMINPYFNQTASTSSRIYLENVLKRAQVSLDVIKNQISEEIELMDKLTLEEDFAAKVERRKEARKKVREGRMQLDAADEKEQF
jgi:hypothetical protein